MTARASRPAADALYARHADGSRVERLADVLRRRAGATPDPPAVIEPGRTTTFGRLREEHGSPGR